MTKLTAETQQLTEAISRLDEVLREPKNDIVRDSAIKRFEFCMDLAWKTIKTRLEEENGIIVHSPNNAFREAYKQGLIEYDDKWIKYVEARNNTVHTYKESLADEIYEKLPEILENLKKLVGNISTPLK